MGTWNFLYGIYTEFSKNVTISKWTEDCILFCSAVYWKSFTTLVNHAINSIAFHNVGLANATHLDQFTFVAVRVIVILNLCVYVCKS